MAMGRSTPIASATMQYMHYGGRVGPARVNRRRERFIFSEVSSGRRKGYRRGWGAQSGTEALASDECKTSSGAVAGGRTTPKEVSLESAQ
jgi:hypothetical protein